MIAVRRQSRHPRAHEIGDTAKVVIQRQNGAIESYTIPWVKSGIALTQVGPIGSFSSAAAPEGEPEAADPLSQLQTAIAALPAGELSSGALTPLFALPANFVRRLGTNTATDFFYSGTFQVGGLRIGFIRIPSYSPSSTGRGVSAISIRNRVLPGQHGRLIVDQMRNPGGLLCYG